jgi:hypothetical protein
VSIPWNLYTYQDSAPGVIFLKIMTSTLLTSFKRMFLVLQYMKDPCSL